MCSEEISQITLLMLINKKQRVFFSSQETKANNEIKLLAQQNKEEKN